MVFHSLLLPRFGFAKVKSSADSRSALMSCLVRDPSFNRTSPFVLIKFIISLEGASSIVQYD